MANSYIQNLYAPDVDPNMTSEEYERSHQQNEELGLNDMNTEDYGHVHVPEEGEEVVEVVESEGDGTTNKRVKLM
jgi:zinc finger protein